MNRVLRRRILRDLKSNFMRYLALCLLIMMGMYIVTAVVGAAENVIGGTSEKAVENKVEDGEFSLFLPLTEEQENSLRKKGITLEEKFSADIRLDDNSVLRVMKNRDEINLIDLDEGRLAETNGEAVFEKRYCEEKGYSIGDRIEVSGTELEIVGIGSVPDYDMPISRFSDVSVESSLFGLAFVTDDQYEKLLTDGSQKAEDYTYAYRLGGGVSDDEVKQAVKDFEFDYNDITDKYFREAIADTVGRKDDLQEGINELYSGSEELSDGLLKLSENNSALKDGAEEIFDSCLAQANGGLSAMGIEEILTEENYGEILDKYISQTKSEDLRSLKASLDGLNEFCQGLDEYTDGVDGAKDGSAELADGVEELKTETDRLIDEFFDLEIENLTSFIKAADNPRILAAAGDMQMNKQTGLLAGVIVMVLFTYVISVFVIHQIQKESSVIGALYALGAKKKDLILHYITLPTAIAFVGGIIGSAIGFSDLGIKTQQADTYNYFSIPEFDKIYPVYLIVYSIVMPPVISVIVNSLVINKRLSQTALSLIRNEQKQSKHMSVKLKSRNFVRLFQTRQVLREMRTGITIVIGMFISLMIFMLGLNCLVLCSNVKTDSEKSVKFEYMYTLKYPSEEIPEGAEACYTESLSKSYLDYTLDITLTGIDSENKYFDAAPKSGKSSVIIGKSTAEKYGLKEGDKLILTDAANDMDYAFTVDGVCDYSVGLTAFMDIDSMRELFVQEEDYYNMLLSDEPLDIDEGRLYSTTSRSDIERSSSVFIKLMTPLIVTMIAVSIIIFCVVMYLMMGVMIDRAGFGISLVKIFGFRSNEIRKLYLDGNTLIVAIGAAICIPLSKVLMDAIYPWMIANTACGMNLYFEWYVYLGVFAGIMLIYFIVNRLLVRKINRVTPAEVLKNRE